MVNTNSLVLSEVAGKRDLTKFRKQVKKVISPILSIIVIAIVWEIIASFQPPYVFPPLTVVLRNLFTFSQNGLLLQATLTTTKSVAIGAVLALLFGLLTGFGLAKYRAFANPFLNFVQTVPYVVWALVSLIWFGLTGAAVVFTIFVAAFPLISFNVAEGLGNVDPHLLGMAKSVKANRYMVWRNIVMPSLTPYLTSGMRAMVGMCWKMSVLAELFAGGSAGGGVGYNLYTSWEFSRISEVFAWTIWLVVLMSVTDLLILAPIENIATRWKRDRQ